jgi:choline dehydrogenase-like flavoprotein
MNNDNDANVLIIGAGFAGLSVASKLHPNECLIVDRGEEFEVGAASAAFDRHIKVGGYINKKFSLVVNAEYLALKSSLKENYVELPLSAMTCNVYTYVQGGISNWWGGSASRISEETFNKQGVVDWPIKSDVLDKYLIEAELAMRVHGDPRFVNRGYVGAIPGFDYWSYLLNDIFPGAHVTSEAKNITYSQDVLQGVCLGNGHCAICSNDAKARPGNSFQPRTIYGNTKVLEINFDGNRAASVLAETNNEKYEITFNKLVIAAGGLENVALLRRSNLPINVKKEYIGRFYQDHTACELIVEMPFDIPYLKIGTEAHIELPTISGYFGCIEVKALLLTVPLDEEHAKLVLAGDQAPLDVVSVRKMMKRAARLYLQIEVPPEWNLSIRSKGEESFIRSMEYLNNLGEIDLAVEMIIKKIENLNIKIFARIPYYRKVFGGHHYSGTTSMSTNHRAVVDSDQLLIGTTNVYINGASVIPRCGGAGPTLTLTALGLRLGDHLANNQNF